MFVLGRSSAEDAAVVEGHIDRCANCRTLVSRLAASSEIVRPTTTIAHDPTVPDDPHGSLREYEVAGARLGTWIKGKYHLDNVVGAGGMAFVYAATHRNRKRFALKMLRPELSANVDIRGRFLREGYIANTVEHPGAVQVIDDDLAEDGAAFLVMELLHGQTAEAVVARAGPLSPRNVLLLAHALLDILAAAHEKSIVHRDIKPANLFMTQAGQLKVLDFGIARLRDMQGAVSATHSGIGMGTPAFMAPEQALGKSHLVDERTDLWAVGATLFWLLSSKLVHQAETLQEHLVMAATRPARPLASVVPDAPPELAEIVDRALAFDREARWQSAATMREAVAAVYETLFGEPVSLGTREGASLRPPPAPPPSPAIAEAAGAAITPSARDAAVTPPPRRTLLGAAILATAALGGGAMAYALVGRPPVSAVAPTAITKSDREEAPAAESVSVSPSTPSSTASSGVPAPGTSHRNPNAPTLRLPPRPTASAPARPVPKSAGAPASSTDAFDRQ